MRKFAKAFGVAVVAGAAVFTMSSASAWWGGGPWGGNNWDNQYNRGAGYGNTYGNTTGDFLGDAAGAGDFSMNMSGRCTSVLTASDALATWTTTCLPDATTALTRPGETSFPATTARHDSSSSAKRSTCPVVFACSSQPPRACGSTRSPVAAASTGAPVTAMTVPFTWITMSAVAA